MKKNNRIKIRKQNQFMILLLGLAILNTSLYYIERVYLFFKNLFKRK